MKLTDNHLETLINADLLRDCGGTLDGIPVVKAWINRECPHTCLVSCPYCGRLHQHSTPRDREPSHRISHCWSGVQSNQGYFLLLQDDEIPAVILEADKISTRTWRDRYKQQMMRICTTIDDIIIQEMTTT